VRMDRLSRSDRTRRDTRAVADQSTRRYLRCLSMKRRMRPAISSFLSFSAKTTRVGGLCARNQACQAGLYVRWSTELLSRSVYPVAIHHVLRQRSHSSGKGVT